MNETYKTLQKDIGGSWKKIAAIEIYGERKMSRVRRKKTIVMQNNKNKMSREKESLPVMQIKKNEVDI